MAADLPGVTGVRGAPSPPSAPLRPVNPARALVPIGPATRGGADTARGDGPLGRSGVSVLDLLAATDLLVEREAVAPVALDIGLETARGALLRQQPGEALEALDAVWPRASASEEGWYLRSGALAVLGLASEADRVASEGLERSPTSLALRFVLSLARTALGDLTAARAAIAPALALAPDEPVLLAQQAGLLVRHGRRADGEMLLARLRASAPNHPALRWAEDEIRKVKGDQVRQRSKAAVEDGVDGAAMRGAMRVEADSPTTESTDLGDEAFARLGVRLSVAGSTDAIADARTLLRAFSTGGALASQCQPDQAHGARTLLASIIGVLRGEVPSSAPSAVQHLVTIVRGGRVAEAERTLPRELRALPFPQRRWAEALLRELRMGSAGAPYARPLMTPRAVEATPDQPPDSAAPPESAPDKGAPTRGAPEREAAVLTGEIFGEGASVVGDRRDDGAAVPVRLGLGLLSDSAAARQAARASGEFVGIDTTAAELARPVGDGREQAALMGGSFVPVRPPALLDLGAVLPPLLALAVAAAAGLNGATAIAVVAVAASVWLALRRRTTSSDAPAGTGAPPDRDQARGID